jgi:hypothetical protein
MSDESGSESGDNLRKWASRKNSINRRETTYKEMVADRETEQREKSNLVDILYSIIWLDLIESPRKRRFYLLIKGISNKISNR